MPEPEPRLGRVTPLRGAPEDRGAPARDRPSRTVLVLGAALLVAIAVLVWSRLEQGARIGALESEAAALRGTIAEREATIAERDRTIAAQSERLVRVRERVQNVLELLDEPVPGAD